MFRSWFSKKFRPGAKGASGAPAVRRLKTYSAQSGYVYQYFFEGKRPAGSREGPGTEYVFHISADRKNWHAVAVVVSDATLRAWEEANARELSATERYAIAKMSLFQAFDERANPSQMKQEMRVRAADIDAIVETLGL